MAEPPRLVQLPAAKVEVNPALVDLFKELLAEAETGGIETLGVVAIHRGDGKTVAFMGDQVELLGSLEQLKFKVLMGEFTDGDE